jgi:hypothetical protein
MNGLFWKHARTWPLRILFACIACAGAQSVPAAEPVANPATLLRAKYATLGGQVGASQFQRPLYLDSVESAHDLKGDIYALMEYPFTEVGTALNGAAHWCDVMILHINTKYCRASADNARTVLEVGIGKKVDQPVADAYRVEFAYRVIAATPDYLGVQLNAENGPLDTSNYRILLEATPLDGGRTILHLTYSYDYGLAGGLAMQFYLATVGRGKVGFTITARQANGQPEYIGGVRGVVERNTMRYFLAIDAYLGALATPLAEQLEKRLQSWYTATELYARQLHDVDRGAYLVMKGREYQRQQTLH